MTQKKGRIFTELTQREVSDCCYFKDRFCYPKIISRAKQITWNELLKNWIMKIVSSAKQQNGHRRWYKTIPRKFLQNYTQ